MDWEVIAHTVMDGLRGRTLMVWVGTTTITVIKLGTCYSLNLGIIYGQSFYLLSPLHQHPHIIKSPHTP